MSADGEGRSRCEPAVVDAVAGQVGACDGGALGCEDGNIGCRCI